MSSAMSIPIALKICEHRDVPLQCIPSTRAIGRRCPAEEIVATRGAAKAPLVKGWVVIRLSFIPILIERRISRDSWLTKILACVVGHARAYSRERLRDPSPFPIEKYRPICAVMIAAGTEKPAQQQLLPLVSRGNRAFSMRPQMMCAAVM